MRINQVGGIRVNKIIRNLGAGLALCALLVALSGCAANTPGAQVQPEVTMPLPSQTAPPAPVGDVKADSTVSTTLYYISSDGQQLVPTTREIQMSGESILLESVLSELLTPPQQGQLRAVAPGGTQLLSVEQAGGVCTVNLSIDAHNVESDQEYLWMRAAITNTLTELPGIEYVNLLIGNKQEGVLQLPSGATTRFDGNLTACWAQLVAEEERFFAPEDPYQLERNVTLYFGADQGGYLLGEVRPVRFENDDYVGKILDELIAGPAGAHARKVFPSQGRKVLAAQPEILTADDGGRIVQIRLVAQLPELLEAEGIAPGQLYGSLAYTLMSFVPDIDGVQLLVGETAVSEFPLAGGAMSFEDGVMRWEDFHSCVGELARLYFTGADGGLTAVDRAMDQQRAVSPRVLLDQLMAGPLAGESGLSPVFPEGLSDADILGIRTENRKILVNLSSNFYRLCQTLTQEQERNLVYAMVNALTELSQVDQVQFYVEGEQIELLVAHIYLRGPLMRNPGLITA